MKRILFLQGTVNAGGSKYSLLQTIDLLVASGCSVAVACPRRGWLTDELQSRAIETFLLPFYAWRKWLDRPRVFPSLRKLWVPALSSRSFDLVHSNEFWWAPHAIYLGSQLNVPAVVHLRDGHHTLKKARQYRLEQASTVFAVSRELREQFVAAPALHHRTHVLFNPHFLAPFAGTRREARQQFRIPNGTLAIANVGRVCARKNQRWLLRVLHAWKKSEPGDRWQLLLAGDADPAYLAEVEADLRRYKLSEQTQILGPIKDVAALYAAADLVAHCAVREGLPRVIPEAMLAGCPVLASRAEGVADAIPDARFGFVTEPGDVPGYCAALTRLAADSELRCQLATSARHRAETLFTPEIYRAQLLGHYAAARRKPSP